MLRRRGNHDDTPPDIRVNGHAAFSCRHQYRGVVYSVSPALRRAEIVHDILKNKQRLRCRNTSQSLFCPILYMEKKDVSILSESAAVAGVSFAGGQ